MKIPKEFNLFGHVIKVEYDKDLANKHQTVGFAVYRENKIQLQAESKHITQKTDVEQAFLHEAVHLILNQMGENELRDNEKFVDVLASLLHQMLVTAKY